MTAAYTDKSHETMPPVSEDEARNVLFEYAKSHLFGTRISLVLSLLKNPGFFRSTAKCLRSSLKE